MAGLSSAQSVLLLDAARTVDQAKVKVGALTDLFDGLPLAAVGIAVQHLKEAHRAIEMARSEAADFYADRPDLRVGLCPSCGHDVTQRLVRGEFVCVLCGFVCERTNTLRVVMGGASA